MQLKKIIYTIVITYLAINLFGLVVTGVIKSTGVFERSEHELKKRSSTEHPCVRDSDCGEGSCKQDGNSVFYYCECDDGWIDDTDGKICAYEQKPELTSFLLSFFVGVIGVDWFYLSCGNGVYIFAGVMKILTLGCCGIWAIVDWIRILAHAFPDGNWQELYNNM